jgi:hypothetical protein
MQLLIDTFESLSPSVDEATMVRNKTEAATAGEKKYFIEGIFAQAEQRNRNGNIKGEPKKIAAMTKAVFASKKFHQELTKPGISVDSIIDKLNEKTKAAAEFEEATGIKWPL